MSKKSIQALLKETFPSANYEKWKNAASQELHGNDPLAALQHQSSDDLLLSPYYDRDATAGLDHLRYFSLPQNDDPHAQPRAWHNLPEIVVTDSTAGNRLAHQLLNQGGDGILFNLINYKGDELAALLENIEWPNCPLFFKVDESHAKNLIAYIEKKNYGHHTLSGGFFWNTLPDKKSVFPLFDSQEKILLLGLPINSSTPVEEVCQALLAGVQTMDRFTEQRLEPGAVLSQISFSLEAGTDFILTIAKFKALRLLWFQIAQAYGVNQYTPDRLHIHGRSSFWSNESFQPHGNMLKATTAAMASILGGCNSLSIQPEIADHVMMSRIALNTSTILKDESHFDKVADPTAGAYAIDYMMNEIAKKAWDKFVAAI